MQITVNGEIQQVIENISVDDFIKTVDLPKFFVVELNKQIIYKEVYSSTILKENDELELVIFTGGG